MKKFISLLLAVCMLFVMPMTALAEPEETPTPTPTPTPVENVNIAIEKYDPTSMVTGGDVSLIITVTNIGDEIQGAVLKVGGTEVATYGTMSKGDSKRYEGSYSVSSAMLDQNIEVALTYTFGGAAKSKTTNFKVSKKAANADVSTKVQADNTSVASGTKVKLTFAVENKGNVAIENATVTDKELNGGSALPDKISSLAPGASAMITYSATITETTTLNPVLKYTADGQSYSKNMDSITINVVKTDVSVSARADKTDIKTGEEVSFSIEVKNAGNIEMRNLVLKDSRGNDVAIDNTTLSEGSTLNVSFKQIFEESMEYVFTLSCSDADGKQHTYTSNAITISVEETDVDYSDQLFLTAEVDQEEYEKSGNAIFTLTLKNTGELTFTNISFLEETLGTLEPDFVSIGPGEEKIVKVEQKLEEDGTFIFEAIMEDLEGNAFMIEAAPLEVTKEAKVKSGISTLLIIIIVIVVLMIAAGVTLIVLMRKEKKRKEEAESARVTRKRPAAAGQGMRRDGTSVRGERMAPVEEPITEEQEEDAFAEEEMPARTPRRERPVAETPAYDPFGAEEAPEEIPAQAPPKKVSKRTDFTDRNYF
ncbi:MAG: DUF7507 domain-containing protein [Christensenellaceae bacterium]|jgi:uncharacterized repeat protein (TIGR01451 family)